VRICAEIIEQIRDIPGVSGVHVMAPGYEHGIPRILEHAGLAPATPTLGGAGDH
jgi:methylenetetrahydrofolate reductase (NADPH)